MLFGVGCTPGGDDNGGVADGNPATITLSKAEAGVGLEGGSVQVDVTSNAAGVVSCEQTDVTYTPATGQNAGTVTITVPASLTVRTVNVSFTATKKQTIAGVVVDSNKTAVLAITQNAAGEVVEGGIASINEIGDYEIEGAWVIANYSAGFLMADNSGGNILVFQGNGAAAPAVGQVVNVKGTVVEYGGFLQFGNTGLSVEVTGETQSVTNPTPAVMTGSDLDSWLANPTVKYVEYEGQLSVSGNYYNVNVAGAATAIGSISYPAGNIKTTLDGLNGKWIKVTGWLIGYASSKYTNTMAVSVVEIDSPNGSGDDNTGATATGIYTSNDAFVCSEDNSGISAYTLGSSTINGVACSGVKLGVSKKAGVFTSAAVGVSGTKTLGFYGFAWKGTFATLYIKVEGSDVVKKVSLMPNDGATSNPPFTITATDADFYSVELTGLTESSKILFSTDESFTTEATTSGRAVLAGITWL